MTRKEPVPRKIPGSHETFTESCGNVFEDVGFPPEVAEEMLLKSKLALRIHDRIKELALTQVKAAKLLGISQPAVSRLMSMRYPELSIYKLTRILNGLGISTDLVLRPAPSGRKIRPGSMRILDGAAA